MVFPPNVDPKLNLRESLIERNSSSRELCCGALIQIDFLTHSKPNFLILTHTHTNCCTDRMFVSLTNGWLVEWPKSGQNCKGPYPPPEENNNPTHVTLHIIIKFLWQKDRCGKCNKAFQESGFFNPPLETQLFSLQLKPICQWKGLVVWDPHEKMARLTSLFWGGSQAHSYQELVQWRWIQKVKTKTTKWEDIMGQQP